MATTHRTWLEISSAALKHNYHQLYGLIGSRVRMLPVVKANAYGHGLAQVIPILQSLHPHGLGVAYGQEAFDLRRLGYRGRIVVLSFWSSDQLPELVRQGIELVAWDFESLQSLKKLAGQHVPVRIHLKLDTGTSRIGFLLSDPPRLKKNLGHSSVQVVGCWSHLANAEEQSSRRTKQQINRFTTLKSQLNLPARVVAHLACTAAVIRYPEAYFGLVRPGIGLYGLWPSVEIKAWARRFQPKLSLQPALRWYTRLSQIKTIPTGTSVGYGSTVTVKRTTRIGILPVGYSDGYDRRLSNAGWVIVNRQRCPVIGRISMNLMMVDLSRAPHAKQGDRVTLIGTGADIEDLCRAAKLLNYEFVSRIHPQLERHGI